MSYKMLRDRMLEILRIKGDEKERVTINVVERSYNEAVVDLMSGVTTKPEPKIVARPCDTEFEPSEFRVPLFVDIFGVDKSWRNDACPSFKLELLGGKTATLWCDAVEPERRKFPNESRYTVYDSDANNTEPLFRTSGLRDLVNWLFNNAKVRSE